SHIPVVYPKSAARAAKANIGCQMSMPGKSVRPAQYFFPVYRARCEGDAVFRKIFDARRRHSFCDRKVGILAVNLGDLAGSGSVRGLCYCAQTGGADRAGQKLIFVLQTNSRVGGVSKVKTVKGHGECRHS